MTPEEEKKVNEVTELIDMAIELTGLAEVLQTALQNLDKRDALHVSWSYDCMSRLAKQIAERVGGLWE